MTINDEFTALNISRQRKYQLRKIKENRCSICGASLSSVHKVKPTRCLTCMISVREKQRIKRQLKKRYLKAHSYLAQSATDINI